MIKNRQIRIMLFLTSYFFMVSIISILIVVLVSDIIETQPYCMLISITIAIISSIIIKIILVKTGLFKKIFVFLKIS